MKKLICLLLSLLLLVQVVVVFAEDAATEEAVAVEEEFVLSNVDAKLMYNGQEMKFVNRPTIIDGTFMVPVREFAEYFKASVIWDEATDSALIARTELEVLVFGAGASGYINDQAAILALGASKILVGGKEIALDQPITLINDRMYAPIEAVANALEASAEWDETGDACAVEDYALLYNK